MREWVSVEGDKEGCYKDEGSVHRDTRLTLGLFGVLIYNLGPYTEILSVLSFPLEYLDWQVQYTQFYPQVAGQQRVNK